jgi:alanine racemase
VSTEALRLLSLLQIKADAYGHGAVKTCRAVMDAGASYVAVASVAEALELRRSGMLCCPAAA